MTIPALSFVKTIIAAEIRDVTHYCNGIAVCTVKRDNLLTGFAPRANLRPSLRVRGT